MVVSSTHRMHRFSDTRGFMRNTFWEAAAVKKGCFGYSAVPLIIQIFEAPASYVINGLYLCVD